MDLENDTYELLNQIILEAITNRASDIHFEPTKEGLVARIRVDGLMRPLEKHIEDRERENLISKIKVLAELNITEHRIPQDGHYSTNYQGENYNFRVSTLPTIYGESIVFRILNKNDQFLNLESLGLLENQLELIDRKSVV